MTRFFFLSLCWLALLPGCTGASDTMTTETASTSYAGDLLEPILVLDLDIQRPDAATVYGPGSAYYLAQIFHESGDTDTYERMLHESWRSNPEPWRRRALVRLLDSLLGEQRFDEIITLVEEGERVYGSDVEIVLYRLEAFYRDQQYSMLLDGLDELERFDPELLEATAGRWVPAMDAALWRAVASFELQTEDWVDRFYTAFSDHRVSPHHSRLFLFAVAQGTVLPRFDRSQALLVEARYHLSDGRPAEAARLFRALVDHRQTNGLGLIDLLEPKVLSDIGHAFLTGGDWRLSATSVQRLIDIAGGQHAAAAGSTVSGSATTGVSHSTLARLYEYQGRLHRSAGNRQAAFAAFDRSTSLDDPGPDRDRVLWYTLQSVVNSDPRTAVRFLEQRGSEFHNPRLIAGLLDTLASRLVNQGNWEALARAHAALESVATEGSLSQYQVVNAVALRAGLIRDGADAEEHADRLLERASNQWENPYYALVAAVLLGKSSEYLDAMAVADTQVETIDDSPEHAAYVSGYFRFGMADHGYLEARRASSFLSAQSLGRFAATLAGSGNYIDSMRLMDVVARRELRVPTAAEAELMYPRAFAQEMGVVIRSEVLEPEIFYALVREESYFSADIQSHAGAVGLSQLMPATAAEVARAMRLQNPNLSDPATNLAIGARYLRSLIDRFDSVQLALIGYNAGPTRVRRWRAENGTLPAILFQEAIPFLETRHYIRKIFITAVQYGRLYSEISPEQVFDILFASP